MKKIILLLICICSTVSIFSQGSIYGKVTDYGTGEELIGAEIIFYKNGVFITEIFSDMNGNFSIPLDAGSYDLKVFYVSFSTINTLNILIHDGQATKFDISFPDGLSTLNSFDYSQQIIPDSTLYCSIYGKVKDEDTNEDIIGASVVLTQNGFFVTGAATNFNGEYEFMAKPGDYDMKVSYTGYPEKVINGIVIKPSQNLKLDILINTDIRLPSVLICSCGGRSLLEQDYTTSGNTITSDQIRNQPVKEIKELIINTPGVSINNY